MEERFLKLTGGEDRLFSSDRYPRPFAFNQEVAQVFDDMVHRSVPLYKEVTLLAVDWALKYAAPNTKIFDIGCSTGTVIECLSTRVEASCHLVGVDCSEAMIERAKSKVIPAVSLPTIDLLCKDVRDVCFKNASVIIVNYTLQFLPIRDRMRVLKRMVESLEPGGLIFLSEKVRSESSEFQETITTQYESFKQDRGYSRLEIEKKKEALENVLVPLTENDYRRQLNKFGVDSVDSIAKWNNFVTLVGMKATV